MDGLTLTYSSIFNVYNSCKPPNSVGVKVKREDLVDAIICSFEIEEDFRDLVFKAAVKFLKKKDKLRGRKGHCLTDEEKNELYLSIDNDHFDDFGNEVKLIKFASKKHSLIN